MKTNQNPIKNLDEFIRKIDAMKKQDKMDLSADQDLSLAIMNLVSLEEHFFFTAEKTGQKKYFDLLKEVREMRKVLLKKIIKNDEGELWCISKHLLAASMRLMEVGTKQLGRDKKKEAYDLFQKSYDLYSLFWAIDMKIIDVSDVKQIDDQALSRHDKEKKGFMGKLNELVKRAINCCIE